MRKTLITVVGFVLVALIVVGAFYTGYVTGKDAAREELTMTDVAKGSLAEAGEDLGGALKEAGSEIEDAAETAGTEVENAAENIAGEADAASESEQGS